MYVRVGHGLIVGIYNLNPPLRNFSRRVRNETGNEQEERHNPNHYQRRDYAGVLHGVSPRFQRSYI